MELKNNSLRIMLTGGDKLKSYNSQKYRLVNNYGPTESTVVSTSFIVNEQYNNIPIGKPINNLNIYIINKNNKLLPIGVVGELCIGGEGLARGYINREELTAEKFIDNPFQPETKMYRTGDIARWLPDGNIEYLGRSDNQVKIRGYRIELEEVENSILQIKDIKDAVVIVRESNSSKELCCYYTLQNKYGKKNIKEESKQKLPYYMIPSYFILLDTMPLTVNGKIDKNKLLLLSKDINLNEIYEAPTNEVERNVVDIWKEVLGTETVGIDSNFFDLGGDSIKAIQIVSKCKAYGYYLEVKDIIQYPQIKDLSKKINYTDLTISQEMIAGEVPLTPIQSWFFKENFVNKNHWNQAIMLHSEIELEEEYLRKVFDQILEHHDALRMTYEFNETDVIQINREVNGELYSLQSFNLKDKDNGEKLIDNICNEIHRTMNLEKGPLVKIGLFNTSEENYLFIAVHHLVIDGVSWRILIEDLSNGYSNLINKNSGEFPNKTTSFMEWAQKISQYANSDELLQERAYWNEVDNTLLRPIPKDAGIVKNYRKDMDTISMDLSCEDTQHLLKDIHTAYNTEINDILLTVLGVTVCKWSGEKYVAIDLEGHGREQIMKDIDISRTIGWFTSMYPIILQINDVDDICKNIKSIKETLRAVPKKGIGYGILKYLSYHSNKEDMRFKLKPEISFNYLGQFGQENTRGLFSFADITSGKSISENNSNTHAIDIIAIAKEDTLRVSVSYNKNQYKTATILDFIECYKTELQKLIKHCLSKQVETPLNKINTYVDIDSKELDILMDNFN